jgi:hypothetical protein
VTGELCPVCIEHPGWASPDLLKRSHDDYCRTCLGSGTAKVITVADGRVAFRGRNVTVARCDRCGFGSALTECLCDHWHYCSDGEYQPECDLLCHSCGATRDDDPTCRDCG